MEDKNRLAELVVELQHGNGEAFEEIYNLTSGKAFATALSIVKKRDDAEDLLQDAYVTVLDKIDTLEKPEAFQGWFNIIVANKAKSFLQKSQPVLFKDDNEESAVFDSIKDDSEEYKPGLDVEKEDLRKDVMSLINNLSDDKRTVILLYYYNEMSIKEIAQALEINENTVKSRLFQAKKDLSKGIKTLEKKDKKLFGIAPGPVITWALKSTSNSAAASFVGSAASAGVLNAVTAVSGAGAAAGGVAAKFAAFSVLQKIVAGVVAASVVTGTAVGTKKIVENRKESSVSMSVAETVTDRQNEESEIFEINTEENSEKTKNTEEISKSFEKDEKTKTTTEKSTSLNEKKSTEKSTSSTATTKPSKTTASTTAKSETTTASTTTTKSTTTTTKRTTTTTKRTTTTTKHTTTTKKPTTTTTKKTTTTTKKTTTTTKPTTTTTKAPATIKINYVVTDGSGSESPVTKNVSAGSTITESDIVGGMSSKYDNVIIRSGTCPVTAESGNTYEYIVYLWNY